MPALIWIVPAVLLVIAPFDWPYGYYTFLRLVVCLSAGCIAFATFQKAAGWGAAMIALALLFNPLFPVYLDKQTWAPIDVGAGVFYVAHWWFVGRRAAA